MKTRLSKLAVTAIMILFACISANAQDVDGISLWDKCTKEQLIQRYGQPVYYDSQEGDSPEDGLIERIRFKDVWFRVIGNNITSFYVKTSNVRTLTKTIIGGIRIGDDASVLNHISSCLARTKSLKDGYIEYRYYLEKDCDDSFYVCVKDGVIVNISAVARTL